MKKTLIVTLIVSLLFNIGNISITSAANDTNKKENSNIYDVTMKQDILCLMIAYPEYIKNIEKNNGYVYLNMKSGRKLCYDDKKVKSIQEKLVNPDLQDTLDQIYPLSPIRCVMRSDFDPGRYRSYGLLSEVYGTSKQVIEDNLTKVNIIYNNYQFNKSNNASNSLQAVMGELKPLLKMDQNLRNCLLPCSGTFNYRVISGTNRLSPHSFGIAIDLASDKRDYWKWSTKDAGEKRLSSYSTELVKIFEKNNFVWGGKWSHFDILHFEYRPEIILKARYFPSSSVLRKTWYEGAPIQEVSIKNAIYKIDSLIK
ncbi:M15 family metallopeptidase [Clostridium estertheticum]|uniref:M15 family metallopeptidase n=1 Tax=Clostridium estertheticum TaxID=238834 RepID=UPI001CF3B12D|nr:M15 family metallopeptidase [Clostridium estertheticum]MCB2306079.1 M15 family metallopeptidase [Clostridium estertheticum]MCB2344252.1 M15 family metallopeptidase [Clostridium estertheticum]MCB2349172.1 M15 family metallopeptidase [Clostridium estertheticum]WAG44922.1 M15 family metallopeptidase [Clostridium estertheticum]